MFSGLFLTSMTFLRMSRPVSPSMMLIRLYQVALIAPLINTKRLGRLSYNDISMLDTFVPPIPLTFRPPFWYLKPILLPCLGGSAIIGF
jgi:hypothetical protein